MRQSLKRTRRNAMIVLNSLVFLRLVTDVVVRQSSSVIQVLADRRRPPLFFEGGEHGSVLRLGGSIVAGKGIADGITVSPVVSVERVVRPGHREVVVRGRSRVEQLAVAVRQVALLLEVLGHCRPILTTDSRVSEGVDKVPDLSRVWSPSMHVNADAAHTHERREQTKLGSRTTMADARKVHPTPSLPHLPDMNEFREGLHTAI